MSTNDPDRLEDWADYFDRPILDEEGPEPEGTAAARDAHRPFLGTVKVVLEDRSCLVEVHPEEGEPGDALVRNEVYPTLRPGDPVLVYPVGESGWSLYDPGWFLPPEALTPEFIRATLGIPADRFADLVAQVLGQPLPPGQPLTAAQHSRLYEGLERELLSPSAPLAREEETPTGAEITPTHGFPPEADPLAGNDPHPREPDFAAREGESAHRLRAAFRPTYGDTVAFTVTAVDPDDPELLHGLVHDTIPGVLRRDALTLPQSLPFYPFDAGGSARKLKVQIVDPSAVPLRVGKRHSALHLSALDPVTRASRPLEQPGLFLLALHHLGKRICEQGGGAGSLPAVVLDVRERMKIDLYGVILDVVPEQTTWSLAESPAGRYREGQRVPVHVLVDLERFTIITSLRSVEGPEWGEVLRRFPPGSVVADCRYFMRTREGLLFHVPAGDLRLHGLVPYGELTEGNEPTFVDPDDLTHPVALHVLGHDEPQRRLVLSWRRARPSVWERVSFSEGDLIPVEVVWTLGDVHWVRWASGHLAEFRGPDLTANQVLWLKVRSLDRQAHRIELAATKAPTGWVVAEGTCPDSLLLRSTEGATVRVVRTPALEETLGVTAGAPVIEGTPVQAVLHRVDFKLDGPRVIFRPRSDLSRAVAALQTGEPRPVTVERFFRRGFLGRMDGLEVFLPFNQVANYKVDDFSRFLGQTFDCRVLEVEEEGGRIVVSRRVLLQEQDERDSARRRRELLGELAVGQVRRGVVRNLVDYGAFVDLGGVSGLLHIREMSWTRISDPAEVVRLEQELEVFILSVDRVRGHVGLSLKQLTPDPWRDVPRRYQIGSCHEGEVVNVVGYGAFIDLEPGVSGLLHLNEMSWRRIAHPSEVVRVSQRVTCRILGIDPDKKHIALSLKQTCEDPWDRQIPARYLAGQAFRGRVTNRTSFGIFVELEPGLEGLLHLSELPDAEIADYLERYPVGREIEVHVVRVETEERKIGLSVRQLTGLQPAPAEPCGSEEGAPPFRPEAEWWETLKGLAAGGPRPVHALALEMGTDSRHLMALLAWAGVDLKNQLLPVGPEEIARVEARLWPAEGSEPVGVGEGDGQGSTEKVTEPEVPGFDPRRLMGLGDFAAPPSPPEEEEAEAEEAPPARGSADLDTEVDGWLAGLVGGPELAVALEQQGLYALASLASDLAGPAWKDPGSGWEPLPPWSALSALREVAAGASRARALEVLLRALAGQPGEALLFDRLGEWLPPEFVAAHHAGLRAWVRRHLRGRGNGPTAGEPPGLPAGLALLRAQALERLGRLDPLARLEQAFAVLNEAAAEQQDDSLFAERDRLVPRFREELLGRDLFFDRLERDFSRRVRLGGFAAVIPVRERGTGELFALKHYLLRPLSPPEMELTLDLFEREAAFLRRVRHVNVVGFRERLGRGCVLLEWLPHRPLNREKDTLADPQGWWTLPRVLEVGVGVSSALQAVGEACAAEFVHNDLAPRNILVHPEEAGRPGWVKLVDFGLSSSPQYNSIATAVEETGVSLREAYRPPEARTGVVGTPTSDVYALGVILFQMCTGQLPFSEAKARAAGPRQEGRLPPAELGRFVPAPVAALIQEMLADDPARRPGDWKVIAARLRAFTS